MNINIMCIHEILKTRSLLLGRPKVSKKNEEGRKMLKKKERKEEGKKEREKEIKKGRKKNRKEERKEKRKKENLLVNFNDNRDWSSYFS